jgi:hypothetical protein
VVSFTSRPLYFQRKSPWYPLDERLGGGRHFSIVSLDMNESKTNFMTKIKVSNDSEHMLEG